MPARKYVVALSEEQRQKVQVVARSYKHSERERKRAKILLLADTNGPQGGLGDGAICEQVGVCDVTVGQVKRRCVEEGVDAALYRREQTKRRAPVLDGAAEAFLIATVCGAPPEGQKRWTLHLLADRLVAHGYVDAVSHETVRQTLKKTNSSPG
jgi:Homeodomain-like domain